MTDETTIGTANTMRERVDESGTKLWLLLRANRLIVTGLLTATVFGAFVFAVTVLHPPLALKVQSGDVIETIFTTMITVIVTGTTLVVTIGQLVLTQENGPLGDQRNRMSASMEVRDFTEEVIGSPSPTDPAEFLGEIIASVARRSRALQASIDTTDDDPLESEVAEFTDSVIENTEVVREQLDGAQFGSFNVVFAALNFNYSLKIFQVERIVHEYEDRLSDHDHGLLDELKTALSLFGPAREHVKTLYFQWMLIDLSRLILYAAVPSVILSSIMVVAFDVGTVPGSTLGIDHIVLVVGGTFAITLVPFLLFVSYLLRILTIAKRTLAIEPLILRKTG